MNFTILTYQMKTLISIGIALYQAKGFYKIALIASTASTLTPLLEAFKKYLFPNFDNLAIFVILLTLDLASGLYKASGLWSREAPNVLNKDIFFHKLIRKVFASVIWLILINVFENFTSDGSLVSEYLDGFGIAVLIAWFAWSIGANLHVITNGAFPPAWVMNRLKKANEDKELKNGENEIE